HYFQNIPSPTTTTSPVIFFFQAEDGIRAFHVTGVQTCALPIFDLRRAAAARRRAGRRAAVARAPRGGAQGPQALRRRRCALPPRSEERRVGKEWRSRGSPYHLKKNNRERGAAGVA